MAERESETTRIERFREFCKRNEPIFTTVVATWLSIVGLAIAVAAAIAAASQAATARSEQAIQQRQYALTQAQTRPRFEIRVDWRRVKNRDVESYVLSNKGYPVTNARCDAHTFFIVSGVDEETTGTVLIPYHRYLLGDASRVVPDGNLVFARYYPALEPDLELERALSTTKDVYSPPLHFRPAVLFDIAYEDVFGKRGRQMYYCDLDKTVLLSEKQADAARALRKSLVAREMMILPDNNDPQQVMGWFGRLVRERPGPLASLLDD